MPEDVACSSRPKGEIKRPTSATTWGVVLLVGSVLVAIVGVGVLVLSYKLRPQSVLSRPDHLRRVLAVVPHLAVAAWGIVTAVGILRMRAWARVSIIAIGIVVTHFSVAVVLGKVLLSDPSYIGDAQIAWIMRACTLTSIGLAGVAALAVVHFSAKSMDSLFQCPENSHFPPRVATRVTPDGAAVVSDQGKVAPLSFMVIAVWLFTVWPLALLSLLRHVRTALPFPMFPLGENLYGPTGISYCLGITLVGAILGRGLMQLKEWARVGAFALGIFTILSLVIPALRPGAYAEFAAYLSYTANVSVSRPSFWLITLWNAAPPIAAMWFLHTRREPTLAGAESSSAAEG